MIIDVIETGIKTETSWTLPDGRIVDIKRRSVRDYADPSPILNTNARYIKRSAYSALKKTDFDRLLSKFGG